MLKDKHLPKQIILNSGPVKVCKLITSTATLHNFCINRNVALLEEDEDFFNQIVLRDVEFDLDLTVHKFSWLKYVNCWSS